MTLGAATGRRPVVATDEATGAAWDGLVTLVGVVGAAVLFFILRDGYVAFLHRYPNAAWVVFATTTVLAAAFYRVDYRALAGPLATITRGCGLAIVAFLVVDPPVLTLANPAHAAAASYVDLAWWPAVGLGLLAVWRRPSFFIPVAYYAISTRYLAVDITYFPISTLDIRYVVDSAMFGAGMMCAVFLVDRGLAGRSAQALRLANFGSFWNRRREDFTNAAAMMAIGFHLGNYFWSGVAKLSLDGGPLSWILENPTQNGILNALEKGTLPTAAWPWLTDLLYRGLGHGVLVMNIVVVVAQLAAIVLIFRVRWLLWLTYFYDLFHIGIYIFGGLFFWPWIWNNLAIVAALRRYRDRPLGITPKLAALAGILLGASHLLGDSARLAWYEVTDIRSNYFEAEAPDGTRVRVPSSFFLSEAYAVSHGKLDPAPAAGHYGGTLWGSSHSYRRFEDDGKCLVPAGAGAPVTVTPEASARLRHVRAYVKAHHAKMLARDARYGRLSFYFRGYHHPSNPFLYPAFNALDLKAVKRYFAVTESVCLRLDEGRLVRTVRNHTEYPIDVR